MPRLASPFVISTALFLAVPTLSLMAAEPVIHLPLNEGAGQSFHSRGSSQTTAHQVGNAGEWTHEVPGSFHAGSAWSLKGQRGAAVVIPGQQLPELGTLDDFTFTGWIRLREAKHLSRIISKSLPKMEALFDLRIDNESGIEPRLTVALRTGNIGSNGYPEKSFELHSESFSTGDGWMAIAIVRESESGQVNFYLARNPESPFQNIGSGKGPIGPLRTEEADLVIGNSRLNMARTADADISDFRIYLSAMNDSELEAVRRSALKETP